MFGTSLAARIQLVRGNITHQPAAAIVKAAIHRTSVVFPGISPGINGYPEAGAVAVAVRDGQHTSKLALKVFIGFDELRRRTYKRALAT